MPTKPDLTTVSAQDATRVALRARNLQVHFQLAGGGLARLFGLRQRTVKAVDGIDLELRSGEVLGLVGESGSGKSTLGRALMALAPITGGEVAYTNSAGTTLDVGTVKGAALRGLRTRIQMVFQDPSAALNPSMTIEAAVGDPLVIHGAARGAELRQRVVAALEQVGLSPAARYLHKYPSDLSGGQKQRAVLARAVILRPDVLVADEPVSMLDMSVRAKILQLMLDLKRHMGLTYVYITHDLASAKFFCDRVAIMYLGKIVEIGPSEDIFARPRHPYTQALLAAVPDPDPTRSAPRDIPRGEIPDAAEPPLGCAFHPRCPVALPECGWESRDLKALAERHWADADIETFRSQEAVLGPLKVLERAADQVQVGTGTGDAAQLLRDWQAADRDEPFWGGVESIKEDGGRADVRFHTPVTPSLVNLTPDRDPHRSHWVSCLRHPVGDTVR